MIMSSRAFFAASPFVSAALGLITVPLMTWTLPDQVIAQFGLFQYASTALLLFVTCGMDQAFLRELSVCQAPGALLRRCIAPCLALLAIASVGVCYWQTRSDRWGAAGSFQPWVATWLLINACLMTVQRFSAQQARISEQGAAYLIAEAAQRLPLVMALLGSLAIAVSIPDSLPINLLVAGTALSAGTLAIRNNMLWRGMINQHADNTVPALSELIQFGFPLALASVMYWALANSGVYITQYLHGAADTARLVVATSLSNVSAIGQAVFSILWLPILYRKLDNGVTPVYVSEVARRVTAVAVLGYVIVAGVLFAAQHLLGEKFRDIGPLATGLSTLPLLYTISEVTFVGLLISRKSLLAMMATGSALLVNLTANALLAPVFAAKGVAIGICLSALAFLVARTEFADWAWLPLERRHVYFGSVSIALTGVFSVVLPAHWGPLAILLVCPYLFYEKKLVVNIIQELFLKLKLK